MIEVVLSELSSGSVHLDRFSWDTVETDGFSSEWSTSVEQNILETLEEESNSAPHQRMNFVIEHILENYPLVSFMVIFQIGGLELSRITRIVSGRVVTPTSKTEVSPVPRISRYQRNPVI